MINTKKCRKVAFEGKLLNCCFPLSKYKFSYCSVFTWLYGGILFSEFVETYLHILFEKAILEKDNNIKELQISLETAKKEKADLLTLLEEEKR